MTSEPSNTVELRPADAASTFLVGDLGGTNCRLGLAQIRDGIIQLSRIQRYRCEKFPTADDAIEAYLAALGWRPPFAAAVLAVAGPVSEGAVRATNLPWRLSESGLQRHGFRRTKLINDFSALALSVEHLTRADAVPLGPDFTGQLFAPVAVIGAGTGFGASALMRDGGRSLAMATEGGHMSFAPVDDTEIEILRVLKARFGRVSVERLLSGPGLGNLRSALAEIHGRKERLANIDGEEIVRQAGAGETLSREAVERFCAIYGAVAGDIALAYGARAGVYLAGGVAPAILPFLQAGEFRRRFEDKGRFQSYVAAIPTRVIVNTEAALTGAAALAAALTAA